MSKKGKASFSQRTIKAEEQKLQEDKCSMEYQEEGSCRRLSG